MWSKVKPETCASAWIFAPSAAYLGPIAIHSALEVNNSAECTPREDVFKGEHFTIPTSILEDG
jgi:hypothetical protein